MLRALLPALLSAAALAQTHYSASLDGAQQVPAVIGNGRGWAIVTHDIATNGVRIFVHFESLAGAAIAANLHQGAIGAVGGIVVSLVASGPTEFRGIGTLTGAQAAALAGGGMYVNVSTAANPNGEIRGQVVVPVASRYVASPSGSQVVPPTSSTAGFNSGVVAFLHEPDNRVSYMCSVADLVGPTAVRFHQAPVGANGPVIATLGLGGAYFTGVTSPLTAAQVAAWKAGDVYASFETAGFPGGEIRGQLQPVDDSYFVAAPSGGEMVPPITSPGVGGLRATVVAGNLYCEMQTGGLPTPATYVTLHVGPVGSNGPVVDSQPAGLVWFALTPAVTASLRAGNCYVTLHTVGMPGGEIRGQLRQARSPTTFGAGCSGSNGVRPQSGFDRLAAPVVGLDYAIRLYGGLPSGVVLLALGHGRDQWLGQPLPVALTSLGVAAPGCYLLIDPIVSLLRVNAGDGGTLQSVGLPLAPSLRGTDFHAQWFCLDPAANPSGLVSSSALAITIQ